MKRDANEGRRGGRGERRMTIGMRRRRRKTRERKKLCVVERDTRTADMPAKGVGFSG